MEPATSQILKQNPSMMLTEFFLVESAPEISPHLIVQNLQCLRDIQPNQWPWINHTTQVLGIENSPPIQDLSLIALGMRAISRKYYSAFDPAFLNKIFNSAMRVLTIAYMNPSDKGAYEPEATEIKELILPALDGLNRIMRTYKKAGKQATSHALSEIFDKYKDKATLIIIKDNIANIPRTRPIPIKGAATEESQASDGLSSASGGTPSTSLTTFTSQIITASKILPSSPLSAYESLLNPKIFPEKAKLLELLRPLLSTNLQGFKAISFKVPLHFRRSQIQSTLPLVVDPEGNVFAILKQFPHAPPLKRGAYKLVYGAMDIERKCLAAWAKIVIPLENSLQFKRMLMNEIKIQQQFNIPEIVRILHVVNYKNKAGREVVGLMMDFCDGGDLEDKIPELFASRNDPKTQADLWNILEDLLVALSATESADIHHRDLKPANIFLVNGLRAKLADFGFANTILEEKISPLFCGSPLFMSPDYIMGYYLTQFGWSLLRSAPDQNTRPAITSADLKTTPPNIMTYAAQLLPRDVIMKLDIPLHLLSERERVDMGRIIVRIGINLGATLKGDLWAAGLILYRMRTGKDNKTIYPNPESITNPEKFVLEALELTSLQIDKAFNHKIVPGSLEELNRRMLSLNPQERPKARECLEIVRKLKEAKAKFI